MNDNENVKLLDRIVSYNAVTLVPNGMSVSPKKAEYLGRSARC